MSSGTMENVLLRDVVRVFCFVQVDFIHEESSKIAQRPFSVSGWTLEPRKPASFEDFSFSEEPQKIGENMQKRLLAGDLK